MTKLIDSITRTTTPEEFDQRISGLFGEIFDYRKRDGWAFDQAPCNAFEQALFKDNLTLLPDKEEQVILDKAIQENKIAMNSIQREVANHSSLLWELAAIIAGYCVGH